jgi:hypothetical protein
MKHPFKPCALIPIVGVPTGDVLIVAHLEGKHTDTIFNVVRQIAYIHERGPFY